MKNKYTNRFSLTSLLALLLLSVSSCTYDYFEDETNYVVYVPKADIGVRTDTYKVDEVKILIYNTSDLERERYSSFPFEDNPRTRVGNFHFKLFPGVHPVFCFSSTRETDFSNLDAYSTANFSLKGIGDSIFKGPTEPLIFENFQREIIFPGPLAEDTAYFERNYVGRIRVVMKNLHKINTALTASNIKKVETRVRNIGTKQMLSKFTGDRIQDSINVRATRSSDLDLVLHTNTLTPDPLPGKGFDYGFLNYYYPSLDASAEGATGEISIEFKILFLGENGDVIDSITSFVVDNDQNPQVLHMNETITLKVDGNVMTVITVSGPDDWNNAVDDGDHSSEGGVSV